MTAIERFRATLTSNAPPEGMSAALQALWWAANSEWDKAHAIVMNEEGPQAAWVHAYLHRVEGDLPNAQYWYRQAGREPDGSLQEEWNAIASALLVNKAGGPA